MIFKGKVLSGDHNAIDFCDKWERNEVIHVKASGNLSETARGALGMKNLSSSFLVFVLATHI